MKRFIPLCLWISIVLASVSCSSDDDNNWAICDVYYQSELNSENVAVYAVAASVTSQTPIGSAFFKITDSNDSTAMNQFEESSQSYLCIPELEDYSETVPSSEEYSFFVRFLSGTEFITENDLPTESNVILPSTFSAVTIADEVVTAEWTEVSDADEYLLVLYKDGALIAIEETTVELSGSIAKPASGWRNNASVSSGDEIEVALIALAYELTTDELFDAQSIVRKAIIW